MKVRLNLVPTVVKEEMAAIDNREAISPYSIAVAPCSFAQKLSSSFDMTANPFALRNAAPVRPAITVVHTDAKLHSG